MTQTCIFCENSAGSREHLWPQWILSRKNFGAFRLKRAGAPEVILNNTELTVKSVCGKCNNGWMSGLEQEAKPLLEQMFDDKPVDLDGNQQQIVAKWVAKMAFLFDSTKGRNADNVFYKKDEGVAFEKSRQIPQFTGIWIGRLDESHRSADGADFTLLSPDARIGGGSSLTLTNEHFVAQIASLRLMDTPTVPTVLNIEPKPGDWSNMLIQIWPIEKPVVHWPPTIFFTNGGPRGYYFLMDRWRIGDEVKKVTEGGIVDISGD
jgi:hypothetical protein